MPPAPAQTATTMTSEQFLTIDDRGGEDNLYLDERVIDSLLLSDAVADKPVVVISVAGAFRTGKSFLLNSMARYLAASDKSNWLDDRSGSFPWRNGCEEHTNGMMMSHPIPVTLRSGEEAVLLLMDTQGIFGGNSSMADSTRIFALSTLLSSVQIFNVMQNLGSRDLDNLQLFAEYGRLALDSTHAKPFQDIIFLIRDWPNIHDHALGSHGGNAFVEKRLNSDKKGISEQREHLRACFTSVSGFLLPYPGEIVAASPRFAGDANDMKSEFITTLEEFMSMVFSQEKLSVKMNGSRQMTCRQLAAFIKTYSNLFRSGEIPGAMNVLQAGAEAAHMAAVSDELWIYVKRMEKLLDEDAPMLDEEALGDKHEQAKVDALKSLEQLKTIRDPTKADGHYSCLLSDKIDDWFKTSENLFKQKRDRDISKASDANERLVSECLNSFDRSVEVVESDQFNDEQEIRDRHATARENVLLHFSKNVVTFGSYSGEQYKLKLENALEGRLLTALELNTNMTAVNNGLACYMKRMLDLLGENAPMLDEGLFFEQHSKTKADALLALSSQLTLINSTKPENYYSCLLEEKIEGWVKTSQTLCKEKWERDRMKADKLNAKLVDECLSSLDKAMNEVKSDKPVGEKKIRLAHEKAGQAALERFSREAVTYGSYSAEESHWRLEKAMEDKLFMFLGRDEENRNMAAVCDCFSTCRQKVELLLFEDAPMLDESLLRDAQAKAKDDSVDALKPQLTKTNSTKSEDYFSRLLVEKIEDWFQTSQKFEEKCARDQRKANEANQSLAQECLSLFAKSMQSVTSNQPHGEGEIREMYLKAKSTALELFRMKKLTFGSYTGDDILQTLTGTMEKRLGMALERNERIAANVEVVERELGTYEERMNKLLDENAPKLDESMLCEEHATAKLAAIKSLDQLKIKSAPDMPENHYSCLLASKIEGWFTSRQDRFKEKCERDKRMADLANETVVNECVSSFEQAMEAVEGDHLKDEERLCEADEAARKKALEVFEAKVITYGSYRAEDHRTRIHERLQKSFWRWWTDSNKRQHDAKMGKGFKVAAAVAGITGAIAMGPAGWLAYSALAGEMALAAAVGGGLAAGGVVAAGTSTVATALNAVGNLYNKKKDQSIDKTKDETNNKDTDAAKDETKSKGSDKNQDE